MQKKVEAYIRQYQMLEQGSRVIAAVSGGADSVCLLHILVTLKEKFGLEIQTVHVHHGLRGAEADRDAEFVRELSEQWKVPCLVVYRDAAAYARERGMGVEEAGRELRYEAFYEAAKALHGARIAVAHHQEDQAETILHNLFRGSGLKGLGGMAPVRDRVIRPLLCVGRRDIQEYLEEQGIGWRQDSTNDSTDYTRNKLRHKVIPMVCQEVNGQAVAHIVAAGERMRQAQAYFEKEAVEVLRAYGREETGEESRYRRIGLPSQVKQVIDLTKKQTGKTFFLPWGIRAYREYDMVWLEAGERKGKTEQGMLLNHPSFSVECFPASILREKHQKIPEKKYTKWFDYDKIKGTLSVRTRQTGDYITLKDGKKKTIKAFMIDEKIPRSRRDEMLLLTEGHHVLWIIGCRISEFYKITDETQQILQEHGGKDSCPDFGGGCEQEDQ